jgi:hypothetical protein
MLDADPKNANVIFPFLNGDDLNSDPSQSASRYVIIFWDWPEERAKKFKLPYAWIKKTVKPERQRLKEDGSFVLRNPLPIRWWQYADKRPALYHAIGRGQNFERHPENWCVDSPLKNIIGISRHTKFFNPVLIPNIAIASDATAVFALDDFANLAWLNSSIVQVWIHKQASTIGMGLRFTPSDCLDTLPQPHEINSEKLQRVGNDYHLRRNHLMTSRGDGLTQIYNQFHNSNERDVEINILREKQRGIDFAVLNAYGWSDIDLGHDFYHVPYLPENDNQRYTISESARVEVLRRLAELNRQRYRNEIDQGLHKRKPQRSKTPVTRKKKAAAAKQPRFNFGMEATQSMTVQENQEVVNQWGTTAPDQILAWLEAHPGWFSKQAVLTGCGADSPYWDFAIAELLGDESIEAHADGKRWRAKP